MRLLQCSDGRYTRFFYFSNHSHVAMWEWSVELLCESGLCLCMDEYKCVYTHVHQHVNIYIYV